jgi:hypothetical protein
LYAENLIRRVWYNLILGIKLLIEFNLFKSQEFYKTSFSEDEVEIKFRINGFLIDKVKSYW